MIWHRECDSDWQCLSRFHQRNRNRDRSYQLKESFSTNLLCWSPSEQSAWPPGPTPLGFVRFQLPQPRTVWLHGAGQSKVFVKTWEWCPALRFQQIPDVSMIPEFLHVNFRTNYMYIYIIYIHNIFFTCQFIPGHGSKIRWGLPQPNLLVAEATHSNASCTTSKRAYTVVHLLANIWVVGGLNFWRFDVVTLSACSLLLPWDCNVLGLPIGWTSPKPGSVRDQLEVILPLAEGKCAGETG